MAALSTSNLTLADWAKRVDPNGDTSIIAELLSQENKILQDMVMRPGNLPTGERVTVRTGLPTVSLRAINEGIAPTKSTTVQIDESQSIFEDRVETDKDLAMLNGNTASFMLSEDMAHLEAMHQKVASTLFYGNPAADPKEFLGLAPRYSSSTAGNSQNVILNGAGGGGDNTSVFLVVWGDRTVYMTFPKGSAGGLQRRDLGEQTVYNADGTRMQALVRWYQWKIGLVVKDWRYIVRICNVDKSDLDGLSGTQSPTVATHDHILHRMMQATARIPNMGAGRPVWYCNRTVFSALQRLAWEKSNNAAMVHPATQQLGMDPNNILSFMGIPMRLNDAIGIAETAVV